MKFLLKRGKGRRNKAEALWYFWGVKRKEGEGIKCLQACLLALYLSLYECEKFNALSNQACTFVCVWALQVKAKVNNDNRHVTPKKEPQTLKKSDIKVHLSQNMCISGSSITRLRFPNDVKKSFATAAAAGILQSK